MKRGRKAKILVMILLGALSAGLLDGQKACGAAFDESKAVRYRDYAASHTIEESMLFIGTYLIHSQSLTDELYEKALDSAADSSQTATYYKSELAGGAWFDISDASGLAEISSQGTVVDESELADLWVTCYTGSDGVTKDAKDGHVVNIFDIPDVYDLYRLEELEPLKLQYDGSYSSEGSGVNRYYHEKLLTFFSLDLKNGVTDACDRQISGLQSCYETLCSLEKEELAEIVSKLMSKIDARRRAEIFRRLGEEEDNELGRLQEICSGSQYHQEDYEGEQFVEDTDVADAIGSSLQNCQESYTEHVGNMLEESDAVLKGKEYEKSMEIISQSEKGWNDRLETLLADLDHIYHIEDNVVADAAAELGILDGGLIDEADEKYRRALSSGEGASYQAAVANGVSLAAREQVLEDQKAEANTEKSELQYLIEAKTKRMEASGAADDIYEKIDAAEAFKGAIPEDDFKAKALESLDEYILWLKELAGSIEDGDTANSSEMKKLEEQKEKLLEEKAEALDNNDLSAAKKYDVLLEEADKQIAAKEQELNAVLASSSATTAEKAEAANQAGDSSSLNRINQVKDAVLSDIAKGDIAGNDGLSADISVLAALGAEDALKEIEEKAKEAQASSLVEEVGQALEESIESSMHGMLESDGMGTGSKAQEGQTISGLFADSGQGAASGILDGISQIKDSVLSQIDSGNAEVDKELSDGIGALLALGAEAALREIEEKAEAAGNSSLAEEAGQAAEDSKKSVLHDLIQAGSEGQPEGGGESGSEGKPGGKGQSGNEEQSGVEGQGEASDILAGIKQIKDSVLSEIEGGQEDENAKASGGAKALAVLGAEDALKELQEKAEAAGASSLAEEIGQAIEDSKESSLHGLSESGSPGDGGQSEMPAALSQSALESLVEDMFGDGFENLEDKDKAAVTAGMERLGEAGFGSAGALAAVYADQCAKEGSIYIFRKLQGETVEYLPLQTISAACGLRYVYSDSKREVTLAKKSSVYRFTVGGNKVSFQDGSEEELADMVRFQGLSYLSEEDAQKYFGCGAEYIDDAEYGVLLDEELEKRAEELAAYAKEGGQ